MHVTRKERGWAGHLCVASQCKFKRNTLLESSQQSIVVSTVGNYCPREVAYEKIMESIGANRYYETMAFHADDSQYKDADVSRQVFFGSPWSLNSDDVKHPFVDNLADQMHENVVVELMEKMTKEIAL